MEELILILLTYTGFNEEFKIHTNSSDFQLGTDISQKVNQFIYIVENLLKLKKV